MQLAGYHVTPTVRLVKLLREGPRGSVWLAESLALDTALTVQLLSPSLIHDTDAVEQFLYDARVAAREKSPHAVQFFGSGVTGDGLPYILQESLPGDDVGTAVVRGGPMEPWRVARLVHQAANELEAAHSAGVVHRGVRPEGLFLVSDGRDDVFLKVLGYDVSAQLDRRLGLPEAAMPLARFMSPELLLTPEEADERADLWSLGAVAYFCLTGRPPFDGRWMPELLVAIDRGTYRPASVVRPELPASLDAFFSRALKRELDARFRTARELDEAFSRCIPAPASAAAPAFAVPSAIWGQPGAPAAPLAASGTLRTEAPVAMFPRASPEYEDDTEDAIERVRDARRRGTMGFLSALLLVGGLVAGGALFLRRRPLLIPEPGSANELGAGAGAVVPPPPPAELPVPAGSAFPFPPPPPETSGSASPAPSSPLAPSSASPSGSAGPQGASSAVAPPGLGVAAAAPRAPALRPQGTWMKPKHAPARAPDDEEEPPRSSPADPYGLDDEPTARPGTRTPLPVPTGSSGGD